MTSNVVISEVGALMYVVLSKTEEQVSYRELISTREYVILRMRCHKIEVVITEFNCIYGPMLHLHQYKIMLLQ
jgi:hypothetical protein